MLSIHDRIDILTKKGLRWTPEQDAFMMGNIYVPMLDVKTISDNNFEKLMHDIDIQNSVAANASFNGPDKSIQLVQGSIEIIKTLPEQIGKHSASLANAKRAVQAFIDKVGLNGDRLNDELDEEANNLNVKLAKTVKDRGKARKPITQIFEQIKKEFTGKEAEINALQEPIQKYRNEYARYKKEEEKRREEERIRKEKIGIAKADLFAELTAKISSILNQYLFDKKQKWQASFNQIDCNNFEQKAHGLANVSTAFDKKLLPTMLGYTFTKPLILTDEDVTEVKARAHTEYDFEAWIAVHNQQMQELKQSLIDQLPSLKQELEQKRVLEEKARLEAEAAEREEKARQAKIAQANAEEKQMLEAEAEAEREKARQRQAEIQAEQERQAREKAEREAQEKARLELEKQEAEAKSKAAAELAGASLKAASLFEASIEATPDAPAPETRSGYEIKVTHVVGWAELFQFWYTKEASGLAVDDIGKKTMNQIKAFAEKTAIKTGEKIESKYLVYEETFKAVNRK